MPKWCAVCGALDRLAQFQVQLRHLAAQHHRDEHRGTPPQWKDCPRSPCAAIRALLAGIPDARADDLDGAR